jgi:YhcH/YjgK/YiaL family protein
MIIDKLENATRYINIYKGIDKAFAYLQTTDLDNIAPGKYDIDGDDVFAIVQEYNTLDASGEQMEAHRKHIDVQYMIRGREQVGLALFNDQAPSKEYSETEDFMLFPDTPTFFASLNSGTFMIFFPTDLHMPCIKIAGSEPVKKVVVKVSV